MANEVVVSSLVSVFPENEYTQTEMMEGFINNYCGGKDKLTDYDYDLIHRVFNNTKIQTCHTSLPKENLFSHMDRIEYTLYVKNSMKEMAIRASKKVIKDWISQDTSGKRTRDDITHIIFGTMTATIHAPSMDVILCQELNLNPQVSRLNCEAMGCLTGFRLTALACDIAKANANNVVLLVVCDIRSSLGNQLTPHIPNQDIDRPNLIVSCLFRDSGAAVIITQKGLTGNGNSGTANRVVDNLTPTNLPVMQNMLSIVDHKSMLLPNSIDDVLLQEKENSAIHLNISPNLINHLNRNIPSAVGSFLEKNNVPLNNILVACHTGGPKVLNAIQGCLKLEKEQLSPAWYVMTHYGNLSGSSNLVTLHHALLIYLKYIKTPKKTEEDLHDYTNTDISLPTNMDTYTHILGLSMGPGIGVELVLMKLL